MTKKTVLSFLLGIFSLAGCTSSGTAGIGVLDGKLKPCPDSANCVSSQSPGDRHGMEAIPYTVTAEEASGRLRDIIKGMEGSSIVAEKDDYIHANTAPPYSDLSTMWSSTSTTPGNSFISAQPHVSEITTSA